MKTLRLDEVSSSKMHIEVNTMQWIDVNRQNTIQEMHKHDYYVIIWVKEGEGTHIVDFNEYPLEPNSFWFLSPGQAHIFHLVQPPQGYVISFGSDFFSTFENNRELLINSGLFHNILQFKSFQLDITATQGLEELIKKMQDEIGANANFQDEMLRSLLKMFLISCSRLFSSQMTNTVESSKAICMVRRFQDLVEERFQEKSKVADYAESLGVTPSHLNDTVKKITGMPASEHIKQRVILEIKRKANFGMLSAKEIAYEMGFDDEAHFSKYFKNNVGITFSDYKKQLFQPSFKQVF